MAARRLRRRPHPGAVRFGVRGRPVEQMSNKPYKKFPRDPTRRDVIILALALLVFVVILVLSRH